MTQVFDGAGNVIPVTVVEAGPCWVTQVKTTASDGYEAIQVGFEEARTVAKPQQGQFEKLGVRMLRHLADLAARVKDLEGRLRDKEKKNG